MKEILFKAKRIDNGEWVYWNIFGELCRESGKRTRLAIQKGATTSYYDYIHQIITLIDKDTICRPTGLPDKNGNNIWENDVCNCIYDGRLAVRVIIWDESELDFKGTNGKENYKTEFDYLGCCEEIEVIGNVFDNGELVKE